MNAALKLAPVTIKRADLSASILALAACGDVLIKAGTIIHAAGTATAFEQDTADPKQGALL